MIAPTLTDAVVMPLTLKVEIVRERPEADAADAVAANAEAPRPTLPRPTLAAAGLFQGWGPRLR